jgi:DNA repair exonuclease SbcCD nuclease subunit
MTPRPAGKPVVLVHSSDLHVDDAPGPGDAHGLAGLQAVLHTAAVLRADLVLLAGDTFDNPRVRAPALQAATALLAASPVPVVLLPGNHDPLLPDCIFRRAGVTELAHVHILGLHHPEAVLFERHGLEIRGRAHVSFADMDPLHPPAPRRAHWQVVMAHGHYVPPEDWAEHAHRSWKISDAALAQTQADYVALGHWDRASPAGDGRVKAYYSGSPDLAGTVNVIRLGPASGVAVERVKIHWA